MALKIRELPLVPTVWINKEIVHCSSCDFPYLPHWTAPRRWRQPFNYSLHTVCRLKSGVHQWKGALTWFGVDLPPSDPRTLTVDLWYTHARSTCGLLSESIISSTSDLRRMSTYSPHNHTDRACSVERYTQVCTGLAYISTYNRPIPSDTSTIYILRFESNIRLHNASSHLDEFCPNRPRTSS